MLRDESIPSLYECADRRVKNGFSLVTKPDEGVRGVEVTQQSKSRLLFFSVIKRLFELFGSRKKDAERRVCNLRGRFRLGSAAV